jgi:hypothetical protein
MNKYTTLSPVIYTFDEIFKIFEQKETPKEFECVENLAIRHEKITFQFSTICYKEWYKSRKCPRGSALATKVILSSLDQSRVSICKRLLDYIIDRVTDGIAYSSIMSQLRDIAAFFAYLNTNNIEINFNHESIEASLVNYSNHLSHQIKIYNKDQMIGLSTPSAYSYQITVIRAFADILKIPSCKVLSSDYIIAVNHKAKASSKPLSDKKLAIQFNQYTYIFRRLSSIILDHEMLPIALDLNTECYWVTHTGNIIHSNSERLQKIGPYNFKESRCYSKDELIEIKRYKNINTLKSSIYTFNKRKDRSNTHYSKSRRSLAFDACKAYFMHFLFITGENDSTAASIIFSKNHSVGELQASFKSIKWRANDRLVKYDIQSEFINDFKIFLKLRDYLLNYYNVKHQELFLEIYEQKLTTPNKSGIYGTEIRRLFSKRFVKNNFDSASRKIRLTKGLWIRKHHGSLLSSYILQHGTNTSNSSYTASNFELSHDEITEYFNELPNQLQAYSKIEYNTASGNCIKPNFPEALPKVTPSQWGVPECGTPRGCLFCNKYRVHSDETDIRKLLSIKYLITQSNLLAHSTTHFQSVYGLLLDRIDYFLKQIKKMGDEQITLINEVWQQVFEQEELSPYWARKLELLDELGIL